MSANPPKKKVCFSEEKLYLVCEWEDCGEVEVDIQVFLIHIVSTHLSQIVPGDFYCHWKDCEGFTDNLSELRRHILLHAFHTKIKCYGSNLMARRNIPNCSSGNRNRNTVPELPDPLICCWENCSTLYECPEHFYRHVDSHALYDCKLVGSMVCLWQDCNRTFTDASKVKEHLRSHTQEKLVACPTCGGMFASRTKFFDHIQRQLQTSADGSNDAYLCEYCPVTMGSERLLRDHMRHHVNHYKCPYCDMTCPTPSGIATHISYRHSGTKPYSCQYCEYKCKTESDLRKHLESHSTIPTFKCPVEACAYASRSKSSYKTHYRKVHEKKQPAKYSCHLCAKIFSRGNYLTKHLLNHHKFRWPSGHCRFRYCLEGDVYKLQTVRYESLELSQEMMGENSELINEEGEIIDDPESFILKSDSKLLCSSQTSCDLRQAQFQLANNITSNPVEASIPVILRLDEGSVTVTEGGLSVLCVPYCDPSGKRTGDDPVLVKIVDPAEQPQTNVYLSSEQPSTVQAITKDSAGLMVYETVEIVEHANDL